MWTYTYLQIIIIACGISLQEKHYYIGTASYYVWNIIKKTVPFITSWSVVFRIDKTFLSCFTRDVAFWIVSSDLWINGKLASLTKTVHYICRFLILYISIVIIIVVFIYMYSWISKKNVGENNCLRLYYVYISRHCMVNQFGLLIIWNLFELDTRFVFWDM